MRFIIYGAGGVGGVIGAQLFKGGEDVVLIARGPHLERIVEQGLHYQTPHGDERLRIAAVDHPGRLEPRPDDVVVLTAKSQHTRAALDDLRAAHGDRVPVVCCQNGVANERMALRRFANVYAMLVYLPAQLLEPGHIQCHAKLAFGILDTGVFPSGCDARCDALTERLGAAGFSIRPDPRVMRLKYRKLLTNLNNALEAIAPRGPLAGEIRERLQAEGLACLAAAGIECASEEEARERRRGVYEPGEIPGVERVGGSSRQSLLRGTGDIEADYLNGEIAYLGRLHGVPTPANAVVQRLAVGLAEAGGAAGSMPLEEVRALIEREAAGSERPA